MPLPQETPPASNSSLLLCQDEAIARMFADCSAFQTEVGEATTADALHHVVDWNYLEADDTLFDNARVLIELGDISRSLSGAWSTQGSVLASIERKQAVFTETNDNYRTSKAEFMRFVSDVMYEMEAKSKAASEQILGFNPLRFNSYQVVDGPCLVPASEVAQSDTETQKVIWWIEIAFGVT